MSLDARSRRETRRVRTLLYESLEARQLLSILTTRQGNPRDLPSRQLPVPAIRADRHLAESTSSPAQLAGFGDVRPGRRVSSDRIEDTQHFRLVRRVQLAINDEHAVKAAAQIASRRVATLFSSPAAAAPVLQPPLVERREFGQVSGWQPSLLRPPTVPRADGPLVPPQEAEQIAPPDTPRLTEVVFENPSVAPDRSASSITDETARNAISDFYVDTHFATPADLMTNASWAAQKSSFVQVEHAEGGLIRWQDATPPSGVGRQPPWNPFAPAAEHSASRIADERHLVWEAPVDSDELKENELPDRQAVNANHADRADMASTIDPSEGGLIALIAGDADRHRPTSVERTQDTASSPTVSPANCVWPQRALYRVIQVAGPTVARNGIASPPDLAKR